MLVQYLQCRYEVGEKKFFIFFQFALTNRTIKERGSREKKRLIKILFRYFENFSKAYQRGLETDENPK